MTDAYLSRQEWIEERAAIYEFEAGFTRKEAERMARDTSGFKHTDSSLSVNAGSASETCQGREVAK